MGKNKKPSSPNFPYILNLITPSRNAMIPSEIAEALKARFFPLMPNADIPDITNFSRLVETIF